MKILKYVVVISISLTILTIGGYFLFKQEFSTSGQITKAAEEVTKVSAQDKVENTEEKNSDVAVGMSEIELQVHLHKMTHGKVVADKKWGKTPITMENVENLITIVEANNYEYEDFYLKHLNDWKNGNFSGAVEVHNRIWTWHGGTIGKATGLMSDAEEERYIKANFGN